MARLLTLHWAEGVFDQLEPIFHDRLQAFCKLFDLRRFLGIGVCPKVIGCNNVRLVF